MDMLDIVDMGGYLLIWVDIGEYGYILVDIVSSLEKA